MTTTTTPMPITIRVPDVREQGQELFDEWATLIGEVDATLGRLNTARRDLADAEAELSILEARAVLEVSGGNAETRKAHLTLLLAEHPAYQRATARVRANQDSIRESERRLAVLKERTRLVRAALALLTTSER